MDETLLEVLSVSHDQEAVGWNHGAKLRVRSREPVDSELCSRQENGGEKVRGLRSFEKELEK